MIYIIFVLMKISFKIIKILVLIRSIAIIILLVS